MKLFCSLFWVIRKVVEVFLQRVYKVVERGVC